MRNKFSMTSKDFRRILDNHIDINGEVIAVTDGITSYSYKELGNLTRRIAYNLTERGISSNDSVAIYIDRSIQYIICELAILYAGASFIPLNKSFPKDRIKNIIDICSPKLVIVDDTESAELEVSFKDLQNEDVTKELGNGSIAYTIFTSGTTGKPKGVVIGLQSLFTLVNAMECMLESHDESIKKVTVFAEFSFDFSIGMIYYTIFSGKTLFIVDNNLKQYPEKLQEYLCYNKIDMMDMTPTYLSFTFNNSKLFSPKYLLLCGEKLHKKLLDNFYKKYGFEKVVYNLYGPTEACVFATFKEYNHADLFKKSYTTIGKSLSGYKTYILNDNLKPVHDGQLFLAGDALAEGYYKDEDSTNDSFLFMPDTNERIYATGDFVKKDVDNELIFIGRKDRQIKVNGYRIELGDIETRILEFPNILDVNVFVKEEGSGKRIVAYYTSKGNIDVHYLRRFLYNKLPSYMIPNYFVMVKSFSFNTNGKLDFSKLPDYKVDSKEVITEYDDDIIKKIVGIIEDTLGTKIDISNSFLYSGGNSLCAFIVASRINIELNVNVPANIFLREMTIEKAVEIIKNYECEHNYANYDTTKSYEASSYQNMLINLEKNAQAKSGFTNVYPQYNIIKLIEFVPKIEKSQFESALQTIIYDHQEFGLTFDNKNSFSYIMKSNEPIELDKYYSYIYTDDKIDQVYISKIVENFEINELPLIKFWLIENRDKSYILINAHHAVLDYYSILVIINELFYNFKDKVRTEMPNYLDYLLKRGTRAERHGDFWREYYLDRKRIVQLNPNGVLQSEKIKSDDVFSDYFFSVDKNLKLAISSFCQRLCISEYYFLFYTFAYLISSYTNQDDIVVGTFLPGRGIDSFDGNIIGTLLTSAGVRFKYDDRPIVSQIKESFDSFKRVLENQCINSMDTLKYLDKKDLKKGDLFKTVFNYESQIEMENKDGYNVTVHDMSREQSFVPLYLRVFSTKSEIKFIFRVIDRVYERDFIESFFRKYHILIAETIKEENGFSL